MLVSEQHKYQACAANGTTDLGTGATGDYLSHLIVNVTTSATGTIAIKDGGDAAITLVPANTPIGVYHLPIKARSRTGKWQVVAGAGASALALGEFTA